MSYTVGEPNERGLYSNGVFQGLLELPFLAKKIADSLNGGITPPPPADEDGIQAAKMMNWGDPVAGDEFTYIGAPKASPLGVYDGPGHDHNGIRTPAAFVVSEGVLSCTGDAKGNTGGMMFKGWSGLTYRVECRMRVRNTGLTGNPYHPVLIMWPNSDKWPSGGEDDYCELNAGDRSVSAFIHHPSPAGGQERANITLDPTIWHNYAIQRSNMSVVGWVDGIEWFRFTGPSVIPVPGPMHPTIQLDNLTGGTMRPALMEVAFLRIYAPPVSRRIA